MEKTLQNIHKLKNKKSEYFTKLTKKKDSKMKPSQEPNLTKKMQTQLKHLHAEIDRITLESIKDNNNPKTILSQFKNISGKVQKISWGLKPYTKGQ